MTTDLRHLLAIYVHAHQTGNSIPPHIDAEARAALAEEPVAPAPPAAGEVADGALALFVESQRPMDPEFAAILTPDVLWDLYKGTPPPADGEVAELTGQLIEAANGAAAMGWDQHAQRILRAAELLQRQALVPVAVSERLPGPEDEELYRLARDEELEACCEWVRTHLNVYDPKWVANQLRADRLGQLCADRVRRHQQPVPGEVSK